MNNMKSECCDDYLEIKCNPDGICHYECVNCGKTHKNLDDNFKPIPSNDYLSIKENENNE